MELPNLRGTVCDMEKMEAIMLCTTLDDFCGVLTSQSTLWRGYHVAEFVV
jgi:hypothetical protein